MKKLSRKNTVRLISYKPAMKFMSWLMIIAMLNLSTGCMNYFRVRTLKNPDPEIIDKYYNQNRTMVLHFEDQAWVLETPELIDGNVVGIAKNNFVSKFPKTVNPDRSNRFRPKLPYDESGVLNEFHIYTNELTRLDDNKVSFPASGIEKVGIHEWDNVSTNGSVFLGGLGATAAIWGGFFIILLLTSCPYIYTFDGENYDLAGEIYSGSIQPQLERHDFMNLPSYQAGNQSYTINITNELQEIQHTNLMELWVFDHDKDMEVAVDKYGNYHTIKDLNPPERALDLLGNDVTDLVNNRDGINYASSQLTGDLPLTEGVVMEFPNPGNSSKAKLFVKAKNTFLLDYALGEFYDAFGDMYPKWSAKQKKTPAQKLRDWTVSQNIPLAVWVERNGKWVKEDYFNITGPIAMKEDVLPINLDGTESDPVRIKLEFGNFLWEIDYAGIDFSINEDIDFHIVQAKTAIDQDGRDVSGKIDRDDKKYYTQAKAGNQAVIDFDLPASTEESRSLILHSKGWYQILRNPAGTPDREYLEAFREPGRFNQFLNDLIQERLGN